MVWDARSAHITGLGVVSALGSDVAETMDALRLPAAGPAPVTLFDTPLQCPVFEAAATLIPVEIETSRTCRMAVHAAKEALKSAGDPHKKQGVRIGVCLGTTVASQLNSLEFYEDYRRTGNPGLAPVSRFLKDNPAAVVSKFFGLKGPRATVVNACTSGTEAIGIGLNWLNAGLCDMVLAGGADEINRVPISGFYSLGLASDKPCRPFDRDRDGLNLGEGAGIVLLECEESAQSRSRESEIIIAGYGAGCDAHHLTAPHPDGIGLETAVLRALELAELDPVDISFINAHGTATPDNDRVEGATLARIFGGDVVFISTKGFTGHTLGAAGGIETVLTALSLMERWIPASPGFENADPKIPVQPSAEPTDIIGDAALSTSLGFGGNNAALVIRRAE